MYRFGVTLIAVASLLGEPLACCTGVKGTGLAAFDFVGIESVTDSSGSSTGSLQTAGGLGVQLKTFLGNTLTVAGVATAAATTESTGMTTGALITAGGLGVAKNVFIGGSLNVAGDLAVTGTISGTMSFTALTVSGTTTSTTSTTGALIVSGGLGVSENTAIGGTLAVTGASTLTGALAVSDATASTTTTTGALLVSGGLGVSKNVFVGGDIIATGSISGANIGGGITTVTGDTVLTDYGTVVLNDNQGGVSKVTFPATADVGNVITFMNIGTNEASMKPGLSGAIYGTTALTCPTSGGDMCSVSQYTTATFIYTGTAWFLLSTNGGTTTDLIGRVA